MSTTGWLLAATGLTLGPALAAAVDALSSPTPATPHPTAGRTAANSRPGLTRNSTAVLTGGLTATVWAALALRLDLDWALPAYLLAGAGGVVLALVDIRIHRLPNTLILPAYPTLAALLIGATLLGSHHAHPTGAALGAAASYALYGLLRLTSPRSIGFGDVKLAGLTGALTGYLGTDTWLLSLLVAVAAPAAVAAVLLASRRARRSTTLALGPYLLVGALVGVLAGTTLTTSNSARPGSPAVAANAPGVQPAGDALDARTSRP